MTDGDRSKEQLLTDTEELRGRIAELETSETDLKKKLKALRDSEKRYRFVSGITSDYFYTMTVPRDGPVRVARISGSFRRVTGYSRKHVRDQSIDKWLSLINPDDLLSVQRSVQAVLSNQPSVIEYRIQTKSGEERWLRDYTRPVWDDKQQRVVSIIGAVQDITNRKLAEKMLESTAATLRKAMAGTFEAMAMTLEMRDPYTAGHERRVSKLACAITEEMALPAEQADGTRFAALIHDHGKIYVPSQILGKRSSLSKTEFGLLEMHPQIGHDILQDIEFPWPIAEIVLQHHERLDGSGYPAGLKADQILLEAKLLGIADVIEAMCFHRPHRPALGVAKALEEIEENKGTLFDADAVAACVNVFNNKGFTFD